MVTKQTRNNEKHTNLWVSASCFPHRLSFPHTSPRCTRKAQRNDELNQSPANSNVKERRVRQGSGDQSKKRSYKSSRKKKNNNLALARLLHIGLRWQDVEDSGGERWRQVISSHNNTWEFLKAGWGGRRSPPFGACA